MIVVEELFDVLELMIDFYLVKFKVLGVDVLFDIVLLKFVV